MQTTKIFMENINLCLTNFSYYNISEDDTTVLLVSNVLELEEG